MSREFLVRSVCAHCKKKVKVRVAIPVKAGKTSHAVTCPLCQKPFTTVIDWGSRCTPPDDLVD